MQRVRELTGGLGCDLVVEAANHPSTVAQAIDMAGAYGRVMLFGLYREATVSPLTLMRKGVTVMGDVAGTLRWYRRAIRWVRGQEDRRRALDHRAIPPRPGEAGLRRVPRAPEREGAFLHVGAGDGRPRTDGRVPMSAARRRFAGPHACRPPSDFTLTHPQRGGSMDVNASMTRRSALLAGAALAAAYALPAWAQDKPTLRFSAVFSEKDIRADMIKMFAEGRRGRLHARALLRRHAVQAGHRARRPAARQPRDGQHRAAGHLQPDPGLVDPDLGLPVPRRRPPERRSSPATSARR